MSDIDPDKLKVAELRDELKNRGLDTKGVKAALVARLKEALAAENPNAGEAEGEEEDFEIQEVEHNDEEDEEEEEEEEEQEQVKEVPQVVDEDTNEGDMQDEANAVEEQQETPEKTQPKQQVQETTPVKATPEKAAENVAEDADMKPEEEAKEDANGDADDEAMLVLGEEFRTIDEAGEGDEEGNTDRKRRRSRSPRHRRSRSRDRHRRDSRERRRHSPPPRRVEMDDTEWEALTTFVLDRYDTDLNLRFHDNGVKAHPLTVDGFAYMWSGVRAMYGIKSGKVAYEVKVLENLNVDHLSRDEPNPHVLRVGWSLNSTSLNLGEEALSWGYEGTGKSCTESNFNDYGQKFGQGDVVTAYLDLDSDPIIISYAKNGEDLGTCFEVPKEKIGDNPLFPHLLTKNTEYECNFGAREGPYFPLVDEFKFLEELPAEERVRGKTPPATKEECEVLMMVGLPSTGKTTYVKKFLEERKDKWWNVLGTNTIIDKMKVMGLPRKENYNGRWEVMIEKANRCMNRLVEIGARKKRNYIIDSTNVYATARRRKMQPFEGFQRKAVVVLPSDEEYAKRVKERTDEEAKDIAEDAVNEMKANLSLPEAGDCFEVVEFLEDPPNKEDRDKLVEKYRKEGRDALPPPEKRYRRESRDFSYRPRGGYRGGYDRERRGGGYRGRSSWRPYNERRGGYRGSYRDDRRRDDRSYGYKGGRGGGYGGGWGGGSGGGWGGSGGGWGSQSGYSSGWNGYDSGYSQRSGWGGQSSGYGGGYNSGGWGGGYSQSGWGSYGYK